MMLCDIGVNLTNSRFKEDLTEVVGAARSAGVVKQIITGTNVDESQAATKLTQQFDGVYATAGVHPHDAANVENDFAEQLKSLYSHPHVVAVGECGLDFNRNFSPPEAQKSVFEAQLQLASEFNMPLFLHERDAFDTQIAMLKQFPRAFGVAHCFTGDTAQLKAYLDLGLYVGITGWLCDPKRGDALREAVKYLPLDRLLVETDAPYLVPKNVPGKKRRNEPKYLPYVIDVLAELLVVSSTTIAENSWRNSHQLFGLNTNA